MTKTFEYLLFLDNPINHYELKITTDKDLELITDPDEHNGILWIGNMTRIEFPDEFQIELIGKMGDTNEIQKV